MEEERLSYLFQRYITHQATKQEVDELFRIWDDPLLRFARERLLGETWNRDIEEGLLSQEERNQMLHRILKHHAMPSAKTPKKRKVFAFARIAAIFLLMAGSLTFSYFLLVRSTATFTGTKASLKQGSEEKGNLPLLTLSSGVRLYLKESPDSVLYRTRDVEIAFRNQRLHIRHNNNTVDNKGRSISVNIKLPAGRQMRLWLADNSQIWLNAQSEIDFPVAMERDSRVVQLQGEAYFEVAHRAVGDQSLPFKVVLPQKSAEIEVLGTHFNVEAYKNALLKTTLYQGAVAIRSKRGGYDRQLKLRPGQQSILYDNGTLALYRVPDKKLSQSMAWKNGSFVFDDDSIQSVVSQLERWYGMQVRYASPDIKERFYAEIPRRLPLSETLKLLSMTGKIKFEMHGNIVTVANSDNP